MKSLNRKVYGEILDWKKSLAGKYALLIEGARRVGKTYLVRQFISNEYESSIFIDFSLADERVSKAKKAFAQASGVADLLTRLQLIFETKLTEGRSCVVFDEVQRFPTARECIKSLVAYGKYHYIETGSLVGIRENVKDILIPSEEHGIKVHPLDFEEFLDAQGQTMLKEHIRSAFQKDEPILSELHDRAMELFRLYMVVGGMPQSVLAYLEAEEGGGLEASESAKREILRLYEEDIGKHAYGYASKVRAIYRMIPSALRRHEKKFHLAAISPDARMRRYENAFLWLDDARVANIAYNATSPDLGVGMSLDSSSFKCYSADTGLLVTQSMGNGKKTDLRILRGVLHENLGLDEGMFFENVVAQTLMAKGEPLFFYSRKDLRDPQGTMEIDFLIPRGIKVCPLEVKSGKYRAHASLDRLVAKFGRSLGRRYVICSGEFERNGDLVYLPAYMAHCL